MEVIDVVKVVLRDTLELGDRVDTFDPSTRLFESLVELDSMAVLNVMVALEERFEITIDDDDVDAETFETLGNLSRFVAAKLAG
jgi:acyl carrier protein